MRGGTAAQAPEATHGSDGHDPKHMLVKAYAACWNQEISRLSASEGFRSPSGLRGLDERAGGA